MTKIIDVLGLKSSWTERIHYYVVVDELPALKYERHGNLLLAEHDGFFDALMESHETTGSFGGRDLSWEMTDGSTVTNRGHIWAVGHPRSKELVNIGVATLADLDRCYVFLGGHVLKTKLEEWIRDNGVSMDYHKYDKRRSMTL